MTDETVEYLRSIGVKRLYLVCAYDRKIYDGPHGDYVADGICTLKDEEYSYSGDLEGFAEHRQSYNLWEITPEDLERRSGYDVSYWRAGDALYGKWDNTQPDTFDYPINVPSMDDRVLSAIIDHCYYWGHVPVWQDIYLDGKFVRKEEYTVSMDEVWKIILARSRSGLPWKDVVRKFHQRNLRIIKQREGFKVE